MIDTDSMRASAKILQQDNAYLFVADELLEACYEIDLLRTQLADQLGTIKALTHGCEKYGLTETTPIVMRLDSLEAQIAEAKAMQSTLIQALRKAENWLDGWTNTSFELRVIRAALSAAQAVD